MIVSDIIDKIQVNLNEANLTYYTEADILEIIQDAYDEIAILACCIEKYAIYPQVNDLTYYNFSSGISDFYKVTGIYNNNTKRWLNARTIKEARLMRADWELWEGEPDNYLISNIDSIAVFPSKLTATGVFIVFYNAIADALTTSSTPRLPVKHFDVLENYATATLLEQAQEFNRASKYLKKYVESISDVRSAAKILALSDRYFIIGDSMPRFVESAISGGEMWIDFETPTILSPTSLQIAGVPSPSTAFYLFRDGVVLFEGIGYTKSGSIITLNSGYEDVTGVTTWRASYRVG